MYRVGFYQDVFREELLEKAKDKHGLLRCEICGWAWLTMDTAKISTFLDTGFGVTCLDENDCFRRERMRMKEKR